MRKVANIIMAVWLLAAFAGAMAYVLPLHPHQTGRARVQATTQILCFGTALKAFEVRSGRYPSTTQGLGGLLHEPPGSTNWNGPYLDADAIPKDPWGNDFIYECPGRHNTNSFDLMSMGPDGHRGTEDDITNWQIKK